MINHYKDPYQTTSIMERFFFHGSPMKRCKQSFLQKDWRLQQFWDSKIPRISKIFCEDCPWRSMVDLEMAHPGCTKLEVVETMHERLPVLSCGGVGWHVILPRFRCDVYSLPKSKTWIFVEVFQVQLLYFGNLGGEATSGAFGRLLIWNLLGGLETKDQAIDIVWH